MQLASPVTITMPPAQEVDGSVRTYDPFTLRKLQFTIIDSNILRLCEARIAPFPTPLILWQGADYDRAGDYTQAQVEARILELLGENQTASLEALFLPRRRQYFQSSPPPEEKDCGCHSSWWSRVCANIAGWFRG